MKLKKLLADKKRQTILRQDLNSLDKLDYKYRQATRYRDNISEISSLKNE
jgi:hypothetical protein